MDGPTTEKPQCLVVEVRTKGTTSSLQMQNEDSCCQVSSSVPEFV